MAKEKKVAAQPQPTMEEQLAQVTAEYQRMFQAYNKLKEQNQKLIELLENKRMEYLFKILAQPMEFSDETRKAVAEEIEKALGFKEEETPAEQPVE